MSTELDAWLSRLETAHHQEIDLGLDRISQVASQLDCWPKADTRVILVAGTNGKGSTCAILDSILTHLDIETCRYSSPHIRQFNERIQIQGCSVADEQLIKAFEQVEQARGDISLTYFEFTTLAAFYCFSQSSATVWIVEVGLGGRLDATNILTANVAIVTSIARDHESWLGSDIHLIGREKAGIFRSGHPAVCGQPDNVSGVTEVARELGTQLYMVDQQFSAIPGIGSWSWRGQGADGRLVSYDSLPVPGLPLCNASAALQALILSGIEPGYSELVRALSETRLAGRLQLERIGATDIMLDVAHNPQAAAYIRNELQRRQWRPEIMIIGMLADKDIQSTLAALVDPEIPVLLVSLHVARGQSASQMAECMPVAAEYQLFDSVAEALQLTLSKYSRILVCGSFYTVAEAMDILEKEAESWKYP